MKFVSALLVLLTFKSYAMEKLEKPTVQVECRHKEKLCDVYLQNTYAQSFIATIRSLMFPPASGTHLEEHGKIIKLDDKHIAFWFNEGTESELHQQFVSLIPLLDRYEKKVPSALIQVTTEIYSITDTGLTDLNFTLNGVKSKKSDSGDDISLKLGSFELSTSILTDTLSLFFNAQKKENQIEKMTTITQVVPNLSHLSYNHTSNIYIAPNTYTEVKVEQIGTTLSGKLEIDGNDNNVVVLEGGNITYGVLQPTEEGATPQVSKLSQPIHELRLEKGISRFLVSSYTSETVSGSDLSLFGAGSTKEKRSSKLLIVFRAKTFSYDELVKDLKENMRGSRFTREEVEKLPKDSVELEEVYSSATLTPVLSNSGDSKIFFHLDRELARKDNIKKRATVRITGGGIDQEKTRRLEQFMLEGIQIDTKFKPEFLSQDIIELKVEISTHVKRSERKIVWEDEDPFYIGPSYNNNNTTLFFEYIPDTNEIY